jgi:DNA mismatch endonuclease (patch repair protein)
MRRQATTDTRPEVALRKELHRRGLRFVLHRRPVPSVRRVADILFTRSRVAVFVDGCYWHGCPDHATWPASNGEFWRAKIEGNRRRDADTDRMLVDAGWITVRVWEHEDVVTASQTVASAVALRSSTLG